ncbi:MAG TPA: alpha/beta hydrolase [Tepidiformaceae bacterium]|nr:alpha/beta hydrolase [Tepidiformaceae bacterium]
MVTTSYLERDVPANGLKLHYQEWGSPSAPPIIMLHGFGVSGHMFDEFAERMQDRYHLIALDQRGHGDSDWAADGDYTRQSFVNDLEAFREALDIERFILIGHSMGGLNAVAYTNTHPQRVRALILVDVGPESAKEGVDNIVRFTRGPDELEFEEFVELAHRFNQRRTIENIRERMSHRLKPLEGGKYTWKFDSRFRQQDSGLRIGSELSNDESWNLFRGVVAPTLLIRGAESDVLSPDVADRATREMQRTRLVVVPGAGHSVPGDNPDDFTAAVAEFLRDLDRGAFAPVSAAEPPPLDQLMEEHAAARKRGLPLGSLVIAGIGVVLALAGAGYVLKRRNDQKKRRVSARARDRARTAVARVPVAALPALDLEPVRRRAVDLVGDLSVVGRDGVERARRSVQDVDFDRARGAAIDAVHATPAAVKTAVAKVDRKKLKKRGTNAAGRGRRLANSGLRAAGPLVALVIHRKRRKKTRRVLWT